MDRLTETATTFGSAIFEYGIASTGGQELQNLGRVDVDDTWIVFKYDLAHSFYLEPLFSPSAFHGERAGGHSLANEMYVALRGQYAFSYRLIPNEEEVAGGMFSVRGYPESITAGDNAVMGTLEYRYHLPRALSVREPGKLWGQDFRWAPQQAYGAADWDLILKAFVDAGRTTNSNPITGENDHTLIGAGVGTELTIKRNLSLRMDLGFALQDVKDEAQTVNAGDARLHFSVTVLY